MIANQAGHWGRWSWKVVNFAYGVHWSWWIPHPYVRYTGTYSY